ncbi:hypothetical protein K488DRAFT_39635, partial [Vararia minispora EC-137]
QKCSYPANAIPSCQPGSPCSFRCPPPYVLQDGQCACSVPGYTECNDVCGRFPHVRIATYAQAAQTCEAYESVCGVHDGAKRGFECLDVTRNLESCGGCMIPHPFSDGEQIANGTDCSAIPSVLSVTCEGGRCAVRDCHAGFRVTADGASCEHVDGVRKHTLSLLD